MIYYAGIGSRETPIDILVKLDTVGRELANKGFTLRSGGAEGADYAFERGCTSVNGSKEIYLPWRWFNNNDSKLYSINHDAMKLAEKYHPYWDRLSDGAKKLQARNSYQVLGQDLKTPSEFIVCWTKDGKEAGGTGQALRIAKDYGIPVFNFGAEYAYERLQEFIKDLL